MTLLYVAAILVVAIAAFYLGRRSASVESPMTNLVEKMEKPVFHDEKGNLRPFYEEVLPGHRPTERGLPGSGLFGYKQGSMITLTCFGNLWKKPEESPKPSTSTEGS